MNYEQADKVKDLAAPVDKVLEGLEWDCSDCKDHLMHQGLSCKYSGKVPYTWTPQVGEWCIVRGDIKLITERDCIGTKDIGFVGYNDDMDVVNLTDITPILEWEQIEKILEKTGYNLIGLDRGESRQFHCDIMRDNNLIVSTIGKSRIEAVYESCNRIGKSIMKTKWD